MSANFWAQYTHDMAHRHVLIAYAFAWLIQLLYLALVLRRSWSGRQKISQDGSSGVR